jgi:hypothetical protein
MLIPEIDGLLKADEKNVQEMRRVFATFSQDLRELLNNAVTLYTTSAHAFTQGVSDYVRDLSQTGMDEVTSNELEAKLMRGLLLCRTGVLYGIAVAEFLHMRITTPFACIRLQCESLALIKLMHETPTVTLERRGLQRMSREEPFIEIISLA